MPRVANATAGLQLIRESESALAQDGTIAAVEGLQLVESLSQDFNGHTGPPPGVIGQQEHARPRSIMVAFTKTFVIIIIGLLFAMLFISGADARAMVEKDENFFTCGKTVPLPEGVKCSDKSIQVTSGGDTVIVQCMCDGLSGLVDGQGRDAAVFLGVFPCQHPTLEPSSSSIARLTGKGKAKLTCVFKRP